MDLRYYCSVEQYYRMPQNSNTSESFSLHRDEENGGCSKGKGKGGAEEENVYVMIPPEPFRREPPLNSTAFLRLKSTRKKRRKDAVFNCLRGAPNHLVPSDETFGIL